MQPTIKRGEIWLVDFGAAEGREQQGKRPAVVLSSDFLNPQLLGLIFVVPGTTRARLTAKGVLVPNHVLVRETTESGLHEQTYFMIEQLRAVAIESLQKRLGIVDSAALAEMERKLIMLLDLPAS
jgi:mRNA interferase MazF